MTIYNVITYRMQEYHSVVRAGTMEEAEKIARRLSIGAQPNDGYWYDSEVEYLCEEGDDAPKADNEEGT